MDIQFNPDEQAKSTDTLQVEMVRRVSDDEVIEVRAWMATQTEEQIHSKFIAYALKSGKKKEKNFHVFIVGMMFCFVRIIAVVIILHTRRKMPQTRLNASTSNIE